MLQLSTDLDDLNNLFEFTDIDLDPISDVSNNQYGGGVSAAQTLSHPGTPFTDMRPAVPMGTLAQDFGGFQDQYGMDQALGYSQQHQKQQAYENLESGQMHLGDQFVGDSVGAGATTQQQFPMGDVQTYQMHPGAYRPANGVPPTPNSYEMHGETGHFLQQKQHYQLRNDDAVSCTSIDLKIKADPRQLAYTPMVSPAGTPSYSVQSEFTVPGAYFSPLTSPMLHAQHSQNGSTPQNQMQMQQHRMQQQQQGYYTNPSTAASSNATSPIDPSLDFNLGADAIFLPEAAGSGPTKRPRKAAPGSRNLSSNRVRQSPVQKPQKRKSSSLASLVPSQKPDQIVNQPAPNSAGLQAPVTSSSEDGSVSPEHLNDLIMGPPPRPGPSKTQSPAIVAQQQRIQQLQQQPGGPAATPKSILSAPNHHSLDTQQDPSQTSNNAMDAGLDDLQLPEAADEQGPHRQSQSQGGPRIIPAVAADQTPRATARKTPKLGPLDTPSGRVSSAQASPVIPPSPVSGSTPAALLRDRKGDVKIAKSKKRSSVSASGSAMLSPAIRPRISPSIKPLLPEGSALHSPTHALLLASKSNYQNLLEGNHLPGVNYPDSLSTGLTSKRTSHKVAEQGRRNRINDALKEMQALLPTPPKSTIIKGASKEGHAGDDGATSSQGDDGMEVDGDGSKGKESKESKEDAAKNSSSSKAATVESANIYIREMQQRDAEREALILQLRRENAEMKQQIEGRMGSNLADSVMESDARIKAEACRSSEERQSKAGSVASTPSGMDTSSENASS